MKECHNNTAHNSARVLFTPELVSLIFSFSQSVTLATPACVCKGWSDAALDQLWEHLSSVFPLVELVLDLDLIEAVGDLASLKVGYQKREGTTVTMNERSLLGSEQCSRKCRLESIPRIRQASSLSRV